MYILDFVLFAPLDVLDRSDQCLFIVNDKFINLVRRNIIILCIQISVTKQARQEAAAGGRYFTLPELIGIGQTQLRSGVGRGRGGRVIVGQRLPALGSGRASSVPHRLRLVRPTGTLPVTLYVHSLKKQLKINSVRLQGSATTLRDSDLGLFVLIYEMLYCLQAEWA